jgi:hypothetical protein
MRVDRGSTVHVQDNTYSVSSRLIGEWVEARLFAERLEMHYGQQKVQEVPRLRGKAKHKIDYRHIIEVLMRGHVGQLPATDVPERPLHLFPFVYGLRIRHAHGRQQGQYLGLYDVGRCQHVCAVQRGWPAGVGRIIAPRRQARGLLSVPALESNFRVEESNVARRLMSEEGLHRLHGQGCNRLQPGH